MLAMTFEYVSSKSAYLIWDVARSAPNASEADEVHS